MIKVKVDEQLRIEEFYSTIRRILITEYMSDRVRMQIWESLKKLSEQYVFDVDDEIVTMDGEEIEAGELMFTNIHYVMPDGSFACIDRDGKSRIVGDQNVAAANYLWLDNLEDALENQ